jgi:hypothetical protein
VGEGDGTYPERSSPPPSAKRGRGPPAAGAIHLSNDRYLLRESPGIDPATADGEDGYRWHGNALAEYGRGARGIALAEQTDATGRVWWFVRMDSGTPPLSAQFAAAPDDPLPTDRLGWMSSRFLQVEP